MQCLAPLFCLLVIYGIKSQTHYRLDACLYQLEDIISTRSNQLNIFLSRTAASRVLTLFSSGVKNLVTLTNIQPGMARNDEGDVRAFLALKLVKLLVIF